jgi:hypothetical protein
MEEASVIITRKLNFDIKDCSVFQLPAAQARMVFPDEAQRPIPALADADARRSSDLEDGLLTPFPNRKVSPVQPYPILRARHGQRLRELARAICQTNRGSFPFPTFVHLFDSGKRLERPDEHRARSFLIGDYVQALMHTVNEVNIRAASGAEQHFGALRETSGSMRGQITQAKIRFGLNDHAGCTPVYQNFAQQASRKFSCVALKIGKIESQGLNAQTVYGATVLPFGAWQRGEH